MTKLKSDLLYNHIHTEIMLCSLVPGSILTERELGERYDSRKATIRNAMARLIQEGFAKNLPRRGYLITPITMRDVSEICDARIVIEPDLTRAATERLTPGTMQNIAAAIRETEKPETLKSRPSYQAANRAFHLTIAQASGNKRLVAILDRLLVEHERIRHFAGGPPQLAPDFAKEHRDLFDAMCTGDAKGAANMMREQLINGKKIAQQEAFGNSAIMDREFKPQSDGNPQKMSNLFSM
ncbi:GntR family transcriptional regulator [Kiloniella sp. EL199]|uniref:GntR family transcriptional regulator n=1 Tax=Kiloniella sp. EL199 TaxID=2107581 RepID=UPI000EA35C52|nr:GntR family transcriptional regulator [Kiloniella sp. EL199]